MAQSDKMTPFVAAPIDAGYDTFSLQIRDTFGLTEESTNVSSGIAKGIGPRYGMAPIPGQSDKEVLGSTRLPGILGSEGTDYGTPTRNFQDRVGLLGVVPITLGSYDDLKNEQVFYAWIVTRVDGSDTLLDIRLASIDTGASDPRDTGVDVVKHSANIADGLGAPEYVALAYTASGSPYNYSEPAYKQLPFSGDINASQDLLEAFLKISATKFANFSSIIVSGRDIPAKYIVGLATAIPAGSTEPAPANFVNPLTQAKDDFFGGGLPACFNSRKFGQSQRTLSFWNIGDQSSVPRYLYRVNYNVNQDPANYFKPSFNQDESVQNVDVAILGGGTRIDRDDSQPVTDADTKYVLMNDEFMVHNSAYKAILAAVKKPIACIFQDWERNSNGSLNQWVDLTSSSYQVRNYPTLNANGGSGDYSEDGVIKQTPFRFWPSWTSGQALPVSQSTAYDGIHQICIGAADTGILRKNTAYEFSYSFFNKKFGYESNVGSPVRFNTGTTDFVGLTLFRDSKSGTDWNQTLPLEQNLLFLENMDLNYTEIRFYYRPLGSQEWLPALYIDAANFYYNPDSRVIWACQGAVSGLPGGQPGFFSDYSPIPNDEYIDVVTFQNRAFWMSRKNMLFSMANNIFAYPLRNSMPCPTGEFRGMKIHTFPGETEQGARLLIYGSKVTYTGRFTGQMMQAPVQISPSTIGTFDVEGSDFTVDEWTTNVAFSARSAVIADGYHFYWGPQGVFKDNGVNLPAEVSPNISPELHELYDANRTDEIHCIYNDQTKEIVWFYPPRVADTDYPTHTLTLNIQTLEFYPGKCAGVVDAAQKVNIEKGDSIPGISGDRALVISRKDNLASVQRAFFFDYRNLCGDIYPGKELMVKSWTSPTTSTREFTLAAGYDSSVFNGIAQGDLVGLRSAGKYSETDAEDFIGIVTGKGTGTITVAIPPGVTFPGTGSLAYENFFQLYFPGIHGIPWVLDSNYWAPGGLLEKWFWRYIFMTLRLDPLLPSEAEQTLRVQHKTPQCPDFSDKDLVISDNSDGHCLIYYQTDWERHAGQALKIRLSGTQFAGHWVLQYLAMFGTNRTFDFLKEFEQ